MFLEINKPNEEITADILEQLPNKYQKSVGFLAWDYARAIAIGVIEKIYTHLAYVCALGDLNNFNYDDLAKFVLQRRGIAVKAASKAKGVLSVSGNGTINVGALFQTASGTQFEAVETKNIVNSGTILIQALKEGLEGNVPAESIVAIPVTIQGIINVTNSAALAGGYEKETKESLIERYLEDLRQPISSGNKYHYKKWAKECTGVGDAKVKPLYNGDNTVKVVIVDDNNEPADVELVNSVQNYIDPNSNGKGEGQAPIGAYCKVESAAAKNLEIEVDITLKSGTHLLEVEENIKKSIVSYLKSVIYKDPYISYAKIGACILDADGVLDYTNLKINSLTDNVFLIDSDEIVEIGVLELLIVSKGV